MKHFLSSNGVLLLIAKRIRSLGRDDRGLLITIVDVSDHRALIEEGQKMKEEGVEEERSARGPLAEAAAMTNFAFRRCGINRPVTLQAVVEHRGSETKLQEIKAVHRARPGSPGTPHSVPAASDALFKFLFINMQELD